jgi:DNA polymerase-3 subunit delta'
MTCIGHDKQLTYLKQCIATGHVSHAYAFVGPHHVGKRQLARLFVAELLNISFDSLDTHPDVRVLARGVDEKKGTLKKTIDIKQLREACRAISATPYLADRSVLIIDEAEYLGAQSANALLKTLEEPAPGAVLVLVTNNLDALPATIASRVHVLEVGSVSDEHMRTFAQTAHDWSAEEQEQLCVYAAGRPGLLATWMADDEAKQQVCEWADMLDRCFGVPFAQQCLVVESLFGDKSDHARQRALLQEVLDIWTVMLRARTLQQTQNSGKTIATCSAQQILEIIQRINEAREQLSQNIHPRLLIEHILFAIP